MTETINKIRQYANSMTSNDSIRLIAVALGVVSLLLLGGCMASEVPNTGIDTGNSAEAAALNYTNAYIGGSIERQQQLASEDSFIYFSNATRSDYTVTTVREINQSEYAELTGTELADSWASADKTLVYVEIYDTAEEQTTQERVYQLVKNDAGKWRISTFVKPR